MLELHGFDDFFHLDTIQIILVRLNSLPTLLAAPGVRQERPIAYLGWPARALNGNPVRFRSGPAAVSLRKRPAMKPLEPRSGKAAGRGRARRPARGQPLPAAGTRMPVWERGPAPLTNVMEKDTNAWGNLRGLTPLSLCDWPGRAACVLFLGGCNLRCPTCHNADLAWRPDRHPVLFGPDVRNFLKKRAPWLDGIVITGGEPSTDAGLLPFLDDLRAYGLPVKVDSNGMRPEVLREILDRGLAQAFSVDVKGPFELYPQLTGGAVSAETAEARLSTIFGLAARRPDAFMFRLTHVPLLTETDVETARGYLPAGFNLTIQNFIAPGRTYAAADSQKGRSLGNLVHGPHRRSHPQGPQGQRHQGPHPVQEARLQG